MLKGLRYQQEPERAWEELIELSNAVEKRVTRAGIAVAARARQAGIAITEGHLSLSAAQRQSDSVRVAVGGVPRAVA